MIFTIKVKKSTIVPYVEKDSGEEKYRSNFLTDDDDTITLFLTESQVKPYINLKRFDDCEIKIKLYRSQKNAKYNITEGFSG